MMGKMSGGLREQLPAVRFGPFEVYPRARELRKRGLRLHLPEKPFQILELLVARAGEAVSRRELREKLWPGLAAGIDRSLNTAINTLRQALGDSARSPRFVETRSRFGYRFIAPVEMLRGLGGPALAETSSALKSIAVLPFENVSGKSEADYLSDGITESILQSVSQLPGIRVIARSTAFRYKGRKADPCDAGRELNVHSVLAGTLDPGAADGETLWISVELVEVASGWRLWGKRFQRRLCDLLSVEKEIAQEIFQSLRMHLSGENTFPPA